MINCKSTVNATLVLRVALGFMFLAHGLAKVFIFTPSGTADYLVASGFPGWLAYPILIFEICAAIMLLIGFRLRAVSILSAIELLGASTAHFKNGWAFANSGGGWEYPVFLAATAIALALLAEPA